MKTLLAVPMAVVLAGCVSISDVTPMGGGAYMVGSKVRGSQMSHTEVKALAVKRADEFCKAQQKTVVVDSTASTGVPGWSPLGGEVVFRCT